MDEPIKVAAGILTVSMLVFAIDSAAPAQTPSNGLPPGASQIDRHQPWSSRYIGVGGSDAFRRRDNGFSGNNSSGSFGGQRFNGRGTFIFGYGYPFYGGYSYPWGYDPYAYGYDPYAYGYGPYVYPPAYYPADVLYGLPNNLVGLGPVSTRMNGFVNNGGLPGLAPDPVGGPVAPAGGNAPPAAPQAFDRPPVLERPNVRISNAESRGRARRYLATGDDHFSHQRYVEATRTYKLAGESAPDLAETWFRQGFAHIAQASYDLAARDFKRGLALNPDWAESSFRLEDVYGDNQVAKKNHIEKLAQRAGDDAQNPDLLLMVGIMLYFDGQTQRSQAFFQRGQVLGLDPGYVAGFLKQLLADRREL